MLIMLLYVFLNTVSFFKFHQFSLSAIYRLESTKSIADDQVLL